MENNMSQNNNAVQPTMAEMQAKIEALQAQLAQKNSRSLTAKISDKGAVSVYGLGRFPVTLYGSQWERLLAYAESIKVFIAANRDKLAVKGETA
jgi:hypothetical protein